MTNGNKAKGMNSAERAAELAKADRKLARKAIKKMDFLTRTQRNLLSKLVDHWLAHRHQAGTICPGREKLAKQCHCSVWSVTIALGRFCDFKFIEARGYPKGGRGRSTYYVVDLDAIHAFALHNTV